MTIYEFYALGEEQQIYEIWNGVFLDVRTENDESMLLYDMGGFYVEVYYEPKKNQITKLRPFKSTKLLSPYLNQMNIEELDSLL